MFDWINKKSYLAISLIVSLLFGVGIYIGLLASGSTIIDSGYVGLSLTILSLVGFGIVKLTMPNPQYRAGNLRLVKPETTKRS